MNSTELQREAERWYKLREAEGIRATTIRAYSDHLHIFCLWLGGKEVTPANFASFFYEYGQNHSPASCRSIYTSVKALLRGIGRGELVGNMKRPRGEVEPKDPYSDGEMGLLWNDLTHDSSAAGLRNYSLVSLLYYTGLRASELCSLELDDLDTDIVRIRGGKSRYSRRFVPLVSPVPGILHRYVNRGRPRLLCHSSNRLFLTTTGAPFNRDALRTMLRRRGERLGFPLSAHRFRHTWVTQHVRARSAPAMLGQMAGWSPKTLYDMMAVYGHSDLDDLRRAQQAAFRPGDGADDLPLTRGGWSRRGEGRNDV